MNIWKLSLKQVLLTALFRAFIRAILTVWVTITLPPAGNTLAIVAHKVRLGTCLLFYEKFFRVKVEITSELFSLGIQLL